MRQEKKAPLTHSTRPKLAGAAKAAVEKRKSEFIGVSWCRGVGGRLTSSTRQSGHRERPGCAEARERVRGAQAAAGWRLARKATHCVTVVLSFGMATVMEGSWCRRPAELVRINHQAPECIRKTR